MSEEDNTVKSLAKGVLEIFEPSLTTLNTHLKELTEKQETIQTILVSEKRKLEDLQKDATLDALLADIATNREKLTAISTNMTNIHRKVQSLQTRASNVERVAKTKAALKNKPSSSNS